MLNFVVAMQSEAQPLIEALSLKSRSDSHAFPVYQSNQCNLVVSGMGKCNSAAATTWLATICCTKQAVWVNAGIAGHRDNPTGTMYCAHSVEDKTTSKTWFPVQLTPPLESLRLLTTEKPVSDYDPDTLHDMEASGFMQAALRFSTAELVQCVKVVSDNASSPVSAITDTLVRQLVTENVAPLLNYCKHLQTLADQLKTPDVHAMLSQFTQQWRFSVTQLRQLQRLLERHQLLIGEFDTLPDNLDSVRSASGVLEWLREELSAIPFETLK